MVTDKERLAEARALLALVQPYMDVAEASAAQFDEQKNTDLSGDIWERVRGINQRIRAWLADDNEERDDG